MNLLVNYIAINGLNEIDVMNFLQDKGVISDLAITARDVFDDAVAVKYLEKHYFP